VAVVIGAKRRRGARPNGAQERASRIVLLALLMLASLTATAVARTTQTKLVRYHGYAVRVPAGWPVFNLAADPTACVRFNRHAIYLGQPSTRESCPTYAAGRTEAILVQPLATRTPTLPAGGHIATLSISRSGVVVTATWGHDPATIEQALNRKVSASAAPQMTATTARADAATKSPVGRTAVAGTTFTGYGFDSCSVPSGSALADWHSKSPFHVFGIYLGGANSACAQAALNATYVADEAAAGWDMIPTYVGLQAPDDNSCGCQPITAAKAASQGKAAAENAVSEAQALGLKTGTPIYDDMEAYPPNATNTKAVRNFLAAWTTQLHAAGYISGVYSSSDSGISDLAAVYGTSFVEPDDLWVANWNNAASTADPNVPTADWGNNQRIHQYKGGHDDTYGGATLNIDTDWVDGAVAGGNVSTPTPTTAGPAPLATVVPTANGNLSINASWAAKTGISAWQLLGGDSLTSIASLGSRSGGGQKRTITVHGQYAYFGVEALSSTTALGSSALVATPPHIAIFGRSVFIPPHGLAGIPVGCYASGGCTIQTTITSGRTTIGKTGADPVAAGTGGIEYFTPTSAGRKLLASAPGRSLSIQVTSKDTSSTSATGGAGTTTGTTTKAPQISETLNLLPYTTSGASPVKKLTDAPSLRILSATAFAYHDSGGGLLVDCLATTPCQTSVKLWHGHTTLAQTNSKYLGPGELGYLSFKLTSAGHSLLASSRGNQVSAHVYISDATGNASGVIALVGYSS
jgi:hypothetical protein